MTSHATPPLEASRPAQPASAHELAVRGFIGSVPAVSSSGRVALEVGDPLAQVVAWVRGRAGREVGPLPTWVRFQRADLGRGALFVVSSPDPYGSAELLVVADRGVLGRGLLVDAAKWAFFALGLTKVAVYIPAGRDDLTDLARRAGFRHEGTSFGHFHGRLDASRWSMMAAGCRWLAARGTASPVLSAADAAPSPSHRVH